MGFSQYIKDTRAEMQHVAWPTQTQTIVYTLLVVLISIAISLYIGFFDFLFTRGLEMVITKTSTPQTAETLQMEAIPVTGGGNLELNVNPGAPVEAVPVEVSTQ